MEPDTAHFILGCLIFAAGVLIGYLICVGLAQAKDKSHQIGYMVIWRHRDDGAKERLAGFWYRGILREIKFDGETVIDLEEKLIKQAEHHDFFKVLQRADFNRLKSWLAEGPGPFWSVIVAFILAFGFVVAIWLPNLLGTIILILAFLAAIRLWGMAKIWRHRERGNQN